MYSSGDGGPTGDPVDVTSQDPALLDVRQLSKSFQVGRDRVQALRGVDFTLRAGQILGLAGESGSGKFTPDGILAGSSAASGGQVRLEGQDVSAGKLHDGRWFKERVQMVFQDPHLSLNPRRTVAQTLDVPLRTLGMSAPARQARTAELLRSRRSWVASTLPPFRVRSPAGKSSGWRWPALWPLNRG